MKRNIFLPALAITIIAISLFLFRDRIEMRSDGIAYEAPPTFESYGVSDIFSGTPAVPDFTSKREALEFRTAIAKGAKEGPNFAGTYTVVSWGCGTACQRYAILDARTGAIALYGNEYISVRGLQFRKDSRLFIVDPYDPNLNPEAGEYNFPAKYFTFEKGKLNEVYQEGCVTLSGKLECGELSFGFIRSFSAKDMKVSVDSAEFLSGTKARGAASKDTGCSVDKIEDCVPSLNNDFYIRNTEKDVTGFTVFPRAVIRAEANQGSPVLAPLSPDEFERAYSNSKALSQSLFKIVRQGNVIISLEQQYTP